MRILEGNLVVVALLLVPTAACAADLGKIKLSILKEPAYTSKNPRYCLLVFGPEARTQVWLVADGDFLYIDRNGNGDLTDPGERVRFESFHDVGESVYAEQREAKAGDIIEGKLKHETLSVTQKRVRKKFAAKERWEEAVQAAMEKSNDGLVYELSLYLEIRPRPGDPIRIAGRIYQSAGMDDSGFLQFATKPEDAPIIHFRGPMQMGLNWPQRLILGDKGGDLMTVVGTAGLGKGTFASVSFRGLISDNVGPVAQIEFLSKVSDSLLPPEAYTLGYRC